VQLSRETRNIINQNFLIGVAFVLGGMTLGAMKVITPITSAIFHVAGSLLVVFNSFRVMRMGEELEPHHGAVPSLAGEEPRMLKPLLSQARA
jgi:hypothetical protein